MATRVPETEHPVLPYEPVRPGLDSRPVDADDAELEALAARRWRVASRSPARCWSSTSGSSC
jgi:hypothetical protein